MGVVHFSGNMNRYSSLLGIMGICTMCCVIICSHRKPYLISLAWIWSLDLKIISETAVIALWAHLMTPLTTREKCQSDSDSFEDQRILGLFKFLFSKLKVRHDKTRENLCYLKHSSVCIRRAHLCALSKHLVLWEIMVWSVSVSLSSQRIQAGLLKLLQHDTALSLHSHW